MSSAAAISVESVSHRYGDRTALDGVSLAVRSGEVFGLLGPNGSGKTTLFRLLATLLPLQSGSARIQGAERCWRAGQRPSTHRHHVPVAEPRPETDRPPKTSFARGGCTGCPVRRSSRGLTSLTAQLSIADRLFDSAETLSGGLKRRVEIAKCLLHEPGVLLLDEPSTGLDPRVRHDLWKTLRELVRSRGLTILVTTHLLDEAEHCTRLAVLDEGRVAGEGTPDELRREVGGDCITITAADPEPLAAEIEAEFEATVQRIDRQLRIERTDGHELVRDLMVTFGDRVQSVTLGRPTLEDVFIHLTGRRLDAQDSTTD